MAECSSCIVAETVLPPVEPIRLQDIAEDTSLYEEDYQDVVGELGSCLWKACGYCVWFIH